MSKPVLELICMICFFQSFFIHYNKFKKTLLQMSPSLLFQKNTIPINYKILDNMQNNKELLAIKSNSQNSEIIHLLYGNITHNSSQFSLYNSYVLYNWNITSNKLTLNFQTSVWNCSVKCQITASQTFFLLEDRDSIYLYLLNSSILINSLVTLKKKNKISILDQSVKIRKKSDINKNHYVYASGKDIQTISYTNNTIITNLFPIPLIYNFNPNNFVLDTKLYLNRLYILYRSIATHNIYLYQFQQIQNLYQKYTKSTQLNQIGIKINQIFRFNNNYVAKVIRFVRGIDKSTTKFIIWAYNQNQAYKCSAIPCIGYGYQIYQNIVFSKVSSTNRIIGFYGATNRIELKTFSHSLISQKIGHYTLKKPIYQAEMISYSSNSVNRLTIAQSKQLFPKVYQIVQSCYPMMATKQDNFCRCTSPYYYNSSERMCGQDISFEDVFIFSSFYIAFITISSILLLTIIFIIYRKINSIQKIRKSWKYDAADHIVFE